MLPFGLRGLGLDPASASTPFAETLVDVTGLVIYFTISGIVLRGNLLWALSLTRIAEIGNEAQRG